MTAESIDLAFRSACADQDAGRKDAAIAGHRGVIAADPSHMLATFNLAVLLMETDGDEACAMFERAWALEPRHAGSATNYFYMMERLGRRDEAEAAVPRLRAAIDRAIDANAGRDALDLIAIARRRGIDDVPLDWQTAGAQILLGDPGAALDTYLGCGLRHRQARLASLANAASVRAWMLGDCDGAMGDVASALSAPSGASPVEPVASALAYALAPFHPTTDGNRLAAAGALAAKTNGWIDPVATAPGNSRPLAVAILADGGCMMAARALAAAADPTELTMTVLALTKDQAVTVDRAVLLVAVGRRDVGLATPLLARHPNRVGWVVDGGQIAERPMVSAVLRPNGTDVAASVADGPRVATLPLPPVLPRARPVARSAADRPTLALIGSAIAAGRGCIDLWSDLVARHNRVRVLIANELAANESYRTRVRARMVANGVAAGRIDFLTVGPSDSAGLDTLAASADLAVAEFPRPTLAIALAAVARGLPVLAPAWGAHPDTRPLAAALRAVGLGEWVAEDAASLDLKVMAALGSPRRLAPIIDAPLVDEAANWRRYASMLAAELRALLD
jgi:hypothetical protein